jgi:hypothetical protein
MGTLQGNNLTEVSGMVVSRNNPAFMWVHNDSGDAARVYALDFSGKHLATVDLPTSAHDFEDIALEPQTQGGDRIYVADTGDNKAARDSGVFIHRFLEPTIAEARRPFPRAYKVKHLETMRLHYPDGPRDAEALLVDPWNGQIVLLTKPKMDPAEIFIIDTFVEEVTPTFAGRLAQAGEKDFLHLVTAADITTDGRWIAVRTYDRIALFPRAAGQSIAAALGQKPCLVPPAWLPQAEAIGFLRPPPGSDSAPPRSFSVVTLGEGAAQPIHNYGFLFSSLR